MKRIRILAVVMFTMCLNLLHAQEQQQSDNKTKKIEGSKMIDTGLSETTRKQVAHELNNLLANEYALYTKTLKYHWNVVGKHFGPLHELFEDQYTMLFKYVDRIAERVRALGFMAQGTLDEFSAKSDLQEQPGINPDEMTMIRNLLAGHEIVIKLLRSQTDLTAQLNDMGTNNMLADLIEKHEKIAWMLRAHLEQK